MNSSLLLLTGIPGEVGTQDKLAMALCWVTKGSGNWVAPVYVTGSFLYGVIT